MNEVFADPQVQHLGLAAPVTHYQLGDIKVVRNGINFSKTPFAVRKAAPDKGAETDEVLKEYGYTDAEIDKLKAGGITAASQ
jgi:formyl-CoA transferase